MRWGKGPESRVSGTDRHVDRDILDSWLLSKQIADSLQLLFDTATELGSSRHADGPADVKGRMHDSEVGEG